MGEVPPIPSCTCPSPAAHRKREIEFVPARDRPPVTPTRAPQLARVRPKYSEIPYGRRCPPCCHRYLTFSVRLAPGGLPAQPTCPPYHQPERWNRLFPPLNGISPRRKTEAVPIPAYPTSSAGPRRPFRSQTGAFSSVRTRVGYPWTWTVRAGCHPRVAAPPALLGRGRPGSLALWQHRPRTAAVVKTAGVHAVDPRV